MKRLSAICMTLLFALFALSGCATQQGWVTLIDGEKGIDNWNRIGDANWRAQGGSIVADQGKGGYLVSKNSYKDFVIYAEFWPRQTPTAAFSSARPMPTRLVPTMPMK